MKFICTADLHIQTRTPKNRKEHNFLCVCLKKLEFILNKAKTTDSKLLIIAGDFFDTTKSTYKTTNSVLKLLNKHPHIQILVVPGQHDLNYHVSGLDNTPLGILQEAGAVKILKNNKIYRHNKVSFIGAGWNEEPEEKANVLIMHRMITKRGELWPGQTNYSTAHAILRKYPWAKCIITGDNHLPHSFKIKDEIDGYRHRLQINCGSLVRSTKTQINFQPRCWKIDTSNWSTKAIKIPIEPAEDVFDFVKIAIEETKEENKKEAEAKIADFINTLSESDKERPNFKKILNNIVQHVKPNDNIRNIINTTMERVS